MLKLIRICCRALSLVLFFAASLVVIPSAHADSAYLSTDTIGVTDAQGVSHDVTTSWSQYVTDSQFWGSSDYSALAASLDMALRGGRFAVSQEHFAYNNSDVVFVYWTEDNTLQLRRGVDNGGHDFVSVGSDGTSKFCLAEITSLYTVSNSAIGTRGGQCFDPGIAPTSYGNNNYEISADNGAGTWIHNLFAYTDYPSDVPAVTTDPLYGGTVGCSATVTAVRIIQDGVAGSASLTYDSSGLADWRYTLKTSSSYGVSVDCGGATYNSVGAVDTPPSPVTNLNWVCGGIYGNGCDLD